MRRRFFPGQPVQTTPGKTVELEVQLRPEAPVPEPAAPAPPSGVCDVVGPALLIDPRAPPRGETSTMRETFAGWRMVKASVPISYERSSWRAIVAGYPTCDISWTWSLEVPDLPSFEGYESYWLGVEVVEQDGTLRVTVLGGAIDWRLSYSDLWEAILTLNAFYNGANVGSLTIKPSFNIRAGGYGGGGGYGYGY